MTVAARSAAHPAGDGAFSGGYSGTDSLSKCSFPWTGAFDFAGAGEISFLHGSTESGDLTQDFDDKLGCARWSGTVTLTSSNHPTNQVSISLKGDNGRSPCGHKLSYIVESGSGRFVGATGRGTVTIECSRHAGSSAYSDQWSGTLSF